jgi:hypothetical protein
LDFMEKITCSNVKAAVQILLEYSPTVTWLTGKVLGASFSWISLKKSLVPTSVRLYVFRSSIPRRPRD